MEVGVFCCAETKFRLPRSHFAGERKALEDIAQYPFVKGFQPLGDLFGGIERLKVGDALGNFGKTDFGNELLQDRNVAGNDAEAPQPKAHEKGSMVCVSGHFTANGEGLPLSLEILIAFL